MDWDESTTGTESSGSTSSKSTDTTRGLGVFIPRLPSQRSDDYFEIRLQFSRKAVAVIVTLLIILSRLVESLGIEVINSIFA